MKTEKIIEYRCADAENEIMTRNFDGILRILKILDETLDDEGEKVARLKEFAATISERRFLLYLQMLAEENLADVQFVRVFGREAAADLESARITIKGLSFLQENSKLRKILRAAEKIAQMAR